MDPFDDILPVAPAASSRAGGRFMPKAKSKPLPRKETSASEHAASFKDGKNEQIASSSTSIKTDRISQNESGLHPPKELPNLEHASNSELGKSQKADLVGFDVGPVANSLPETNLSNCPTQPVQSSNAVEDLLSNVAAPSASCSTSGGLEEPPKNGEDSFIDGNKHPELLDDSLQVGSDVSFKSASVHGVAALESNIHSDSNIGREQEVKSINFELDPFSSILPDPDARNAHKFRPEIKSQPREGTTPATASTSSTVMMEKTVEMRPSCTNKVQSFLSADDGNSRPDQSTILPLPVSEILRTRDFSDKFTYMCSSIPFSEDNKSLGTVDSLSAMPSSSVQNEARDWPSSFGKSAGESADIFSGLESIDDFLTQTAADTAQDSLTFNEATVLNEDDTRTNDRRSETEEALDLNPACLVDGGFDYPSMKSGTNPTSEIPVHEELTNVADRPTVADFLYADVNGGKEDANEKEKDGTASGYLRKHKVSSISVDKDKICKPSRQLRKQPASKPVYNAVNDDFEDDDNLDPPDDSNINELEQNDDEFGLDQTSKKKSASTGSKKKSEAKSGKTSQRKRAKKDSGTSTKETPKKFSHSTRRRKRCVEQALLDAFEDEFDRLTLPVKDIILVAEYKEGLAKKEATSRTSSVNRRDGDSLHETGANNEEEILGSEDGRDRGDDQANEEIPLAPSLFNYQSFMDKEPRGKWSKQDTELFYEAVRQFGTDFSMIQQLFHGRTRHQVKLKYKKEERQHPMQLYDAVNNRAKDHSHFKLVIERLQQASTKTEPEQDPSRCASDVMTGEEVEELTPGTNEEVVTTNQDANVKGQQDSVMTAVSPEQSDDSDDDDFQRWSQYKSEYQ